MKIAEFIKRENDLDVYDNVCEEIGIAFCGPLKLTAEGKLMFAEWILLTSRKMVSIATAGVLLITMMQITRCI